MISATASGLQADAPAAPVRITYIVRADAKTGRLVRSAARPPRAVPERNAAPQIVLPFEDPPSLQDVVERIALQHAVETDLVHSVIRVESHYNPYAVSAKGARGLMQLDPSTARRFGVNNSFSPTQNVEAGVRYLKYLLDLYKGDYRLALAAYNAGEGAVDRWGGIPPYRETRDYVNEVGKKLGEARDAKRKAVLPGRPPAAAADGHNPIQRFVDALGRTYYRTP